MPYAVPACRVCGGRDLAPLIGPGDQALTGVLPRRLRDDIIAREPDLLPGGGSLLLPLPRIELVRA